MKQLRFQLYSIRPLTNREFRLPDTPVRTKGAELTPKVQEFFRSLGVFYYRDERQAHGYIVEVDEKDPIRERMGFNAYYCLGILNLNLSIDRWDRDMMDAARYKKMIDRYGDDFCWLTWNKPVVVITFNRQNVELG